MRINNNLMAMNTHRQMGVVGTSQSKSMEKLSSGYRINRAGDDAAGLAISEKMRAQVRGLNQASRNAQDGISLIQTAEGALSETHDILQRMKELATQSSNGTLDDVVDRVAIQDEVDSLNEELDRISSTASFNGIKLLDGSIGKGSSSDNAYNGTSLVDLSANSEAVTTSVIGVDITASDTVTITVNGGDADSIDVEVEDSAGNKTTTVLDLGKLVKNKATGEDVDTTALAVGDQGVIDLTDVGLGKIEFTVTSANATAGNFAIDLAAEVAGLDFDDGTPAGGGTLTLQVGDTNDTSQEVSVAISDMDSAALGVGTLDVSSQSGAQAAISTVTSAINTVSSQRASLGAVQNRLEHTIKNLDTSSENLQASESRIRDVDMAKEMMEFTKNNILMQAAQSMLAQANQAPQGVLSLLR